MKKVFLILLLFPLLSFAKYYEGTITFSDGKTLSGFIENPEMTDKDIKYKATENDKKQEFKTNEIDKVVLTLGKDDTATYVATKYYEANFSKRAFVLSEDKIWIQLFYDGKLKIYYAYVTQGNYNGRMASQTTNVQYFMKSPKKDYPQPVFTDFKGFVGGKFNYIKKATELYLKDECPNFGDLMIKEEIKTQGYQKIGFLFDEKCGK